MAKKYSVQVENDEVVSVEVDGVTYKNPDEITDEEDREKIQKLISRTTGEDADDAFDKDFDEETKEAFREMDRQTSILPKILLAIFLGVALINLVIAAFSSYSSVQTLGREESTPGQVVNLVVRTSQDSQTGEVTDFSYPVVEFTPPGKQLQRVQMSEGSSPPDYAVGDAVTVLYDPIHLRDARIKSTSSGLLLWILPGITLIVGLAFAFAAFMVFKFFMVKPKK
jgi:hypothetical protein